MLETAQNREPDARKRRSTRIVQAVPLNVTGVDALGRPFQERTSSLAINCHGCRYQSKHYVLKNMWVTLEVPHPEAGRPPRMVRGRVTWIQRPRTVRELFQIGAELELPGNFWGIAFPPPDWFPFADATTSQARAEEGESDVAPSRTELVSEAEPISQGNNVVQMAAATTPEFSLNLARQASKLVNEAKQQIQAAAREAASKLVSQESRQILQKVETQLNDAAAKAIQAAAEQYAKHWLERADERIEHQSRAAVEALRENLNHEVEKKLEEARTLVSASVSGAETADRQTLDASLTAKIETALEGVRKSADDAAARAEHATKQLEQARLQFEESVERARQNLEGIITSRVAEADTRMEELKAAAGGLANELRYSLSLSENAWRSRMESEMAAAQNSWNAQFAAAAQEAAEIASARATEISAQNLKSIHEQINDRFSQLQSHADELQAITSGALSKFREDVQQHVEQGHAAAAEIAHSTERVSGLTQQIESIQQAASQSMKQTADGLMETITQELNRRTDHAIEGISAKLQPVVDNAASEAVARISSQLEQELAPKIATAEASFAKLTTAQLNSDEALRDHQERLRHVSEHAVQESTTRLQQNAERVERDWQEAARSTTERLVADLDTRASDITHSTIESLYKSASWYEKKVQTQMQSTLEKHIEEAGETFRAKAGEISGLFGSELDHYSRSFIEHSQEQLEQTAQEAVGRTTQQLNDTADTNVNDGVARIREAVQLELQRFATNLQTAFDQSVAHLEAHSVQVRSRISSEARELGDSFQKSVAQETESALTSAQAQISAETSAAQELLRAVRETYERQFEEMLAEKIHEAARQALTNYTARLDSTSNAWLVSSWASLHEQGEAEIEKLTGRSEEKLRGVFNEIFGNVGAMLQNRLKEIGTALPPAEPPSPVRAAVAGNTETTTPRN